ncbi:MAG: DUF2163 domain-containing protein [Erythrobacter sp.]|nr:DUF2163 domain-containing protein [Erythrobacter sp.]
MTRTFFTSQLEGVATWWRVLRRDGVTLGFTSHNRALAFDGITHLSAPGMLPSAIRRTASLDRDSLEVEGVLSHDAISTADLESGRYTDARIVVGLVDWETRESAPLFQGTLGNVSAEDAGFVAELRSAKVALEDDVVPRTSPTCRAVFCDARCRINPVHHTCIAVLDATDLETNSVTFTGIDPGIHLHGQLRWIDGPHAGIAMQVVNILGNALVLDKPISGDLAPGQRAYLREGCDHTVSTCTQRFANSVNFQGEPFLPGNDLLARYPTSSA